MIAFNGYKNKEIVQFLKLYSKSDIVKIFFEYIMSS